MNGVLVFSKDRKARRRQRLLLRLCEAQNWRCCYCGVVTEWGDDGPRQATREHVKATSLGGKSTAKNGVMACKRCNTTRGNGCAFTFMRGVQIGLERGHAL